MDYTVGLLNMHLKDDMERIFSLVLVSVVFSLKWIPCPLMNPNAAGLVPRGHRAL